MRQDVIVGRIVSARGVRGELNVEVLTDFPARFSPGSLLYLDGLQVRVEHSREHKTGVVVKIDMVSDRAEAERLRGLFLTVRQDDVTPLPEGSYYLYQIIDMEVWSEDGKFLGRVKEVLPGGGVEVYVVRQPGHKDLLLQATAEIVVDVNPGENRMVVRVPVWEA